jgi:transposase InsO family protein
MRDHRRAELAIAALSMAIQRQKPPPGLIHHSNRGGQYAAADYRKVLGAAEVIPSMRRKKNCLRNSSRFKPSTVNVTIASTSRRAALSNCTITNSGRGF